MGSVSFSGFWWLRKGGGWALAPCLSIPSPMGGFVHPVSPERGGGGRTLGLLGPRLIGLMPFRILVASSFVLFFFWLEMLFPWLGEKIGRRDVEWEVRER